MGTTLARSTAFPSFAESSRTFTKAAFPCRFLPLANANWFRIQRRFRNMARKILTNLKEKSETEWVGENLNREIDFVSRIKK